jgi:hypothetical protein
MQSDQKRTGGLAAAFVALAALFGATGPAAAATITGTWTGTIVSGTDSGIFVPLGEDLTGETFKLVMTYDTSLGTHTTVGALDGYQGPAASAVITIAGTDFSFPSAGTLNGLYEVAHYPDGLLHEIYGNVEFLNGSHDGFNYMIADIHNVGGVPTWPTSIFDPYTAAGCPGTAGSCTGQLSIEQDTALVDAQFTVDSADIVVTGAPQVTPIPATLPLFASGLGGIGLLGWRRKNAAAQSAA